MEKDRLIYTLSRFDHFFDNVNNKTAAYIAINTFVTGGVLAGYTQVYQYITSYEYCFNIVLGLVLLFGLSSLIMLVRASIPFFSTKPNSIYFFGSIGKLKKDDFIKKSKNYSMKDEIKDLREQVHILSKGLNAKFVKLKIAGTLLLVQFIMLSILIIIFLINKF
jgi:Pycsar effector protein